MKDFLQLPFKIYRNDPNWVAPLNSEVRRTLDQGQNPYFKRARLQLFICYKNNEAVARSCVVINPDHCEKFREKTAFFGFFESKHDKEAAHQLFKVVNNYCRKAGSEYIEGPFNPNHYSELGLQIDRFDTAPVFFETYNPKYYLDLLEEVGFKPVYRIHTRKNSDVANYVRRQYGDITSLSNNTDFSVRNFNLNDLNNELERVREVYNDAFSDNWHFLPISREEYLFSAKFLKLVTCTELIIIVEHNSKPVGVLQCVLNINPLLLPMKGRVKPISYFKFMKGRKATKDLIIYAIGIKKEYQRTQVLKLLLNSMCSLAKNYQTLTTTWMSEDNLPAVRASEYLGLKPYKNFAVYGKSI
jgi:hypothetical protein